MSELDNKAKVQERTYKDAKLEISSRTIASSDYVMQISNISQAGIGDIPKKRVSTSLVLICAILSIACFSAGISGNKTKWLMIFIALLAIGVLLYHLYNISNQSQQYGLTLELSSGTNMFFVSEDKRFLRDVLSLIDERMQSPGVHQEVYIAQFGQGSIQNYHGGSGDIITGGNVSK
ncbi:DUF6232 family protein [Eubacteriales bacterium OttesenSCG-928-K08]|nr:DUF6232 family protein [Eubacteriales bacterium OttesenSCG-928-K08]